MDKMIKLENINVKFKEKIVFNDFNLDIAKAEKIVITGNSGVGKSTLFNLFLGFIKADIGDIYINNLSVNSQNIDKIRKQISYIPQNVNIPFNKAKDLFNAQFLYSKINLPNIEKIKEIFKDFNLKHTILEHQVSSLSGGEKQRILLISSILTNKKLLLWDEPTSALDLKNKEILLKYVKNMENITILSISHDDFWINNATRVVKL